MRFATFLLSIVLAFSAVAPAIAQSDAVLLPVSPSRVFGANGSLWHTYLIAFNASSQPVDLDCRIDVCVDLEPASGYVFRANARHDPSFIHLSPADSASVRFALRTRAIRADGTTVTMEVPTARASDFRAGTTRIMGVPAEEGFRLSLRVYGLEQTAVRVRIAPADRNSTVAPVEELFPMQPPSGDTLASGLPGPAWLELHDLLGRWPQFADPDLILMVSLESVGADVPLWAFATSTNNETMQFNHFTP